MLSCSAALIVILKATVVKRALQACTWLWKLFLAQTAQEIITKLTCEGILHISVELEVRFWEAWSSHSNLDKCSALSEFWRLCRGICLHQDKESIKHSRAHVVSFKGVSQNLSALMDASELWCWSRPTICNKITVLHGCAILQRHGTHWHLHSFCSHFMLCGFNIRWRRLRERNMFVASLVMLACHLGAAADIKSGRQPGWYMKCVEASKGHVIEKTARSCYHENMT